MHCINSGCIKLFLSTLFSIPSTNVLKYVRKAEYLTYNSTNSFASPSSSDNIPSSVVLSVLNPACATSLVLRGTIFSPAITLLLLYITPPPLHGLQIRIALPSVPSLRVGAYLPTPLQLVH